MGSKGGSSRRRRQRRTMARIPRHSNPAMAIAMRAKPHGHCVVVAANATVSRVEVTSPSTVVSPIAMVSSWKGISMVTVSSGRMTTSPDGLIGVVEEEPARNRAVATALIGAALVLRTVTRRVRSALAPNSAGNPPGSWTAR